MLCLNKWKGRLSIQIKIQVAQIYGGKHVALLVEISPVHQQNGIVDCGVFAIAFATDLCHGFDQKKMRRHLISCLEKKRFQPFPKIQGTVNINAREFITIKVYCSCRLPEKYDRSVRGALNGTTTTV